MASVLFGRRERSVEAETAKVDLRQEIRFAVVMYGGVSLAIYINGVAQELFNLVREVRHPNGVVEDGDVTAFPTVTNNVQQVTLDTPAAGTYEIRVRGVSVTQQAPGATGGPSPRQDFALVVSNAESLSG
jgi:hypothetical protein